MKEQDIFASLRPNLDLKKYFTKGKGKILDLGAGYGADSFLLANLGYSVIALDRKNYLKMANIKIKFLRADIRDLQFGKFDGIIMSNVLRFINPEERFKILKHYLGCLKPGGVLYIKTLKMVASPKFLELFSTKPYIKYFNIEDNHPPYGKHIHEMVQIVFINCPFCSLVVRANSQSDN